MKLVNCNLETQLVFENKINVLCVENPIQFRNFCQQLYSQTSGNDGDFILSDGEKVVDLSKFGIVIGDCFNLDFNDKKIVNKLYAKLQNICNEKFLLEVAKINQDFFDLFEKLNVECDVSLDYSADCSVTNLLKCFGVTVATYELSFLERLICYVDIVYWFLGCKIIFFVNLKSFLSSDEMEKFYKHLLYNEINVVLLENCVKEKLSNEFCVVIDKDLCEIIV